jgi:hypothetical protein
MWTWWGKEIRCVCVHAHVCLCVWGGGGVYECDRKRQRKTHIISRFWSFQLTADCWKKTCCQKHVTYWFVHKHKLTDLDVVTHTCNKFVRSEVWYSEWAHEAVTWLHLGDTQFKSKLWTNHTRFSLFSDVSAGKFWASTLIYVIFLHPTYSNRDFFTFILWYSSWFNIT